MGLFRALTIGGGSPPTPGSPAAIANANTLAVGNGIDTNVAAALLIGATLASSLTLGRVGILTTIAGNLGVTGTETITGGSTFNGSVGIDAGLTASGAVANNFSGSTGAFLTSTGAVTIGPGAVGVSGAASFTAAGTALAVTNNATVGGTFGVAGLASFTGAGTGLAVTNNASVGGNLTVTGTLTAGAFLQNASVSGAFTTTALATAGLFGYASSPYTLTKTDAAAYASTLFIGASNATGGQLLYAGVVPAAQFSTAGGAPTVGAAAFIEFAGNDGGADAGKLTVTAPTTAGQVVAQVGVVVGNILGAGPYTADVFLSPSAPIQL